MTARYITDKGVATVPRDAPTPLAAWYAATELGLSLGNYTTRAGTRFVVQDRCPTDRDTLGLTIREYDYLTGWRYEGEPWHPATRFAA